MIQTEMVGDRIRHYSNSGMMLRQIETGALYEDAVDVVPCRFTYEETTTPIPQPEAPDGLAEAAQYLLQTQSVFLPTPDPDPDYLNEHEPEPDYFNSEVQQ